MEKHVLSCPVCKKALYQKEKQYVCEKGHSFDIAKQGYTNLFLQSAKHSGDNKEMVHARTQFLHKGFYAPLKEALIEEIAKKEVRVIVDAGCGEGYYTNAIQANTQTDMYAFDLSKEALKQASKAGKECHYFLSSIFALPLANESADMVLNIFAPYAKEEYLRILKKGGYLIKVDPNKKHLYEMKEVLYDKVYENEVFSLEEEGFVLESYQEVDFMMELENEDIASLFMMTPYFYKTGKERAQKLLQLSHLSCRASFVIYIYKKR